MIEETTRGGVPPGEALGAVRAELEALLAQGEDLRGYFRIALEDAREGGIDARGVASIAREYGEVLRRLDVMVGKANDVHREATGIVRGGYALDLAAAREEVFTRLDKLARASKKRVS
ncbi:MAG: hypothetical protein ACU0BS_13535 [Hasllibacter sp.]